MNSPKSLTPILIVVSWMTYRILGFVFLGSTETFGGDVLPNAWIIPLGQDGLIGITAPIIAYLIATRPRVLTYAISLAWVWWGIADFIVGMVTEHYYPPHASPFGDHTPDAMLSGWLLGNLAAEIYAFYLLLTPEVRKYFISSENTGVLAVAESPMKGRWRWIIVGAALMGLSFQVLAKGMDGAFQMMGF